jgi:hypothetical protein
MTTMERRPRSRARTTSRRGVAPLLAVLVVLVLLVAGALVVTRTRATAAASCVATVPEHAYRLDPEQAANATTIAAVGKRRGVPDHAVTIALAASLQESKLHNLSGGDRDSVGLFQQRPSQGWGDVSQLMQPAYAAGAFYRALDKVTGWETMSVTDAAQHVQRSAAPDAYARWEDEARTLARVMTGEVTAGLACRNVSRAGNADPSALRAALESELGVPSLDTTLAVPRGWTVASWVVAHAPAYDVSAVAFDGMRWTSSSGRWSPAPGAGAQVTVQLGKPAT